MSYDMHHWAGMTFMMLDGVVVLALVVYLAVRFANQQEHQRSR